MSLCSASLRSTTACGRATAALVPASGGAVAQPLLEQHAHIAFVARMMQRRAASMCLLEVVLWQFCCTFWQFDREKCQPDKDVHSESSAMKRTQHDPDLQGAAAQVLNAQICLSQEWPEPLALTSAAAKFQTDCFVASMRQTRIQQGSCF